MNNQKTKGSMRLLQMFSFVCSGMFDRGRIVFTSLNIALMAIAVIYVCVLGYYSSSIVDHQKDAVSSDIKRIVAICPEDLNESMRFDIKKKREMRFAVPSAAAVFEQIRRGLDMRVAVAASSGGRRERVFAESTVPEDPGIDSTMLVWGRNVGSSNCNEVVVSELLVERLWKDWTYKRTVPMEIEVSLSRFGTGSEETFTKAFKLVGVRRGRQRVEAFFPIDVMKYFDLWADHEIERIPDAGGSLPVIDVPHQSARVFAESSVSGQDLQKETEQFTFDAVKLGSFNEPVLEGLPVLIVSVKDHSMGNSDVVAINDALAKSGVKTSRLSLFHSADANLVIGGVEKRLTVRSVETDDPRLAKCARTISRLGSILVSENLTRHVEGGISVRIPHSAIALPLNVAGVFSKDSGFSDADIICLTDTLAYISSDFRTRPFCLAWSTDPAVIAGLETVSKERLERGEVACNFPTGSECKHADTLPCNQGDPVVGYKSIRARILQDKEFASISIPSDGNCLPIIVSSARGEYPSFLEATEFRSWEKSAGARVVGLFKGPSDEVWFPESAMTGTVKDVTTGLFECASPVGSHGGRYSMSLCMALFDGAKKDVAKNLQRLSEGARLPLEIIEMDEILGVGVPGTIVAICRDASLLRMPFGWARTWNEDAVLTGNLLACEGNAVVVGGTRLAAVRAEGLHKGILVMSETLFTRHMTSLVKPEVLACAIPQSVEVALCDALHDGNTAMAALSGYSVRRLFTVKQRGLNSYRIKDMNSKDGVFDKELMRVLRSERIFLQVCPDISVQAALKDKPTMQFGIMGSTADDMTRFTGKLEGSWLSDNTSDIILPADVANGLGIRPGDRVDLVFEHEAKRSAAEPVLTWPVIVQGVMPGDCGYMPMGLVKNLKLWCIGKIAFDQDAKGFVMPQDLYERTGHTRCNVYVHSVQNVEPAVLALKKMGYRTEDSLEEQANLNRLSAFLGLALFLLVFGTVTSSVVSIILTTWMNARTKSYEIGVLRASGFSRKVVVSMFMAQGVMLGIMAFIIALPLSLVTEPCVTALLAMHLPIRDALQNHMASSRFWGMYALCLLCCMGLSAIGVTISSLGACLSSIGKLIIPQE